MFKIVLQKQVEIILMRQLASYLTLPVFVVDPEGNLLYYNPPAEPRARRDRCRPQDPTPRPDGRSRRHPDPHPADPSAHGSHPGPGVFRPSLSRRSGGARLWPPFHHPGPAHSLDTIPVASAVPGPPARPPEPSPSARCPAEPV